jgi:membrane protein CcdC involved in cytochrome C biogenesis
MLPVTPRLRLILDVFAGLALIAGALLFFGATRTDAWWSWTIAPPLTAATLGAFYWAAFVLILSAARSRSWAAARPAVYPVAVIALLLLVITLIHLDRFDLDSLFGVFWVVAYVLVPLLLAWALADQLSGRDEEERGARRPSGGVRRLPIALRRALIVEGAVMVAAGVLLLIAPGAADEVWPWALSPLTSRAIGSFLFGIGVAALIAVRDDDPLSFRGAAGAYTGLGLLQLLALNLHIPDLGDRPLATVLYAAFWVAVVLTGGYGLRAARASSRS